MQTSNLIESLKERGWDFLIPIHLEKTATGEYVDYETLDEIDENSAPKFQQYNYGTKKIDRGMYEPEVWDDDYEDLSDWDEDEEDEEEEQQPRQNVNQHFYDRPETLADLKEALDFDYLSDEEFLNMQAGEIFGITNAQLKFVSQESIQSTGVGNYKDLLKEIDNSTGSIEQKIKLANVMARTYLRPHMLPFDQRNNENYKKIDKYTQNIVFKHTENDAVQLLDWYKDYLGMYTIVNKVNDEHKEAGQVYFDYPLFPKPSHIKDIHDKASRDYTEYMSKKAAEREESTNKLIEDFIASSRYKKNLYKGDEYSVLAVSSVKAIIEEGQNLKHCVANYIEDFAKGDSFLYFIRRNDTPDKSLYTVELLENSSNKKHIFMELNQCYGYRDTTEKSDALKRFILEWCGIKKISINCPI